jgi:hypothetical protein
LEDWLVSDFENTLNETKAAHLIESNQTLYFWNGHIIIDELVLPYFLTLVQLLTEKGALEIPKIHNAASPRDLERLTREYRNHTNSLNPQTLFKSSYEKLFWCALSEQNYMNNIRDDIHRDFSV